MSVQTSLMTYDDALELFLATRGTYGGGLSNHGPMATEALDQMGAAEWIGPFVTDYLPRLDPRTRPPSDDDDDWHDLLARFLPDRVVAAAAEAGHELLRVAHDVRGLERAEAGGHVPNVRVDELRTALMRWKPSRALPAPSALIGDRSVAEWSAALAPLATFDRRPGLLTVNLAAAARQPGFVDIVATLQPAERPQDTLDRLAMRALEGYLANEEYLSRFTMLHGVTVSTMARVLVDHLDAAGQRRLEGAVAGFVAAAAVAYDRRVDTSDAPLPPIQPSLAHRAGATLDDHTIKFTNACLGLAERTGSELPLHAAELQIRLTS
ncbi:MAG: hypothetical protein HKN41_04135 [Ilumatobacter sp.]|nr:hypothetical protein [Ilumatobacter sp.]